MTPTNELRWVERTIPVYESDPAVGKIIHVLQQKWVMSLGSFGEWHVTNSGEWRDVPVVKE